MEKNKNKEMIEKAANKLSESAMVVEAQLAKQKSKLGSNAPAVTVAVLVMLLVALVKEPMLLVYGAIVALLVLSPKILKKIMKEDKPVVVKKKMAKKPAEDKKTTN